jgi:catalase
MAARESAQFLYNLRGRGNNQGRLAMGKRAAVQDMPTSSERGSHGTRGTHATRGIHGTRETLETRETRVKFKFNLPAMPPLTMKLAMPLAITLTLLLALLATAGVWAAPQESTDISQQIFDVMVQLPGNKPGNRLVHAKGIVCEGSFTASKDAATVSKAAHLSGKKVPVTVRFSDAAPNPSIADVSRDSAPRGMAIRFILPGGAQTDIVSFAHNGFVVATAEEFLALQKSVVATDPSKPHPWPVEAFLGAHPAALKFVQEVGSHPAPTSFATEAFFGNNAFVFVNKTGAKQAGRYQILPVAGQHYLSDTDTKAASADLLVDEIRKRLAAGLAKFRLVLQLPNAGDKTNDATAVWPDDRKTVELGIITLTGVVANSDQAQKDLAFDPVRLTDGIELSDDPLPMLRSKVYLLSNIHRHSTQ